MKPTLMIHSPHWLCRSTLRAFSRSSGVTLLPPLIVPRTGPVQCFYYQAMSSRSFMATTQEKNLNQPFEEEKLPGYEPDQFWPIHIGETLNSRYTVVGKLGFGANSTVWLCRDLNDDTFVAVKVYVKTQPAQVHREQVAYARLCTVQSSHPGRLSIRPLFDSFYLSHPDGTRHYCLVHSPLHMTMFDLQRFGGQARVFPEDLVKDSLRSLLQAIDFLHTEAGIAHCDIKLSNLMLQIKDTSVLAAFADAEQAEPVPGKVISAERTIYGTRKIPTSTGACIRTTGALRFWRGSGGHVLPL